MIVEYIAIGIASVAVLACVILGIRTARRKYLYRLRRK